METLNHMKSHKLKYFQGGNIAYRWDTILVDAEYLDSERTFNPNNLGYIVCIFDYTYDSRFHLWTNQKYKEVMEFIKKLFVCDKYVMRPDEIITYISLVQEDMCEYRSIF